MLDELVVVTPGIDQGVRQDGHPLEGTLLVDDHSDSLHRAVLPAKPSGVDANLAERQRTVDVAEKACLGSFLLGLRGPADCVILRPACRVVLPRRLPDS